MCARSPDAIEAEFVIRKPRAGEPRELAELHVECWRQTHSHLLAPDYFCQDLVGQRLPTWQNIVSTGAERPVVIAEHDSHLIEFGPRASRSTRTPRPLELYNLYLHVNHQGCGTGQALMDAAIDELPAFLWFAEGQSVDTSVLCPQPVPCRRCCGHRKHRSHRSAPHQVARAGLCLKHPRHVTKAVQPHRSANGDVDDRGLHLRWGMMRDRSPIPKRSRDLDRQDLRGRETVAGRGSIIATLATLITSGRATRPWAVNTQGEG